MATTQQHGQVTIPDGAQPGQQITVQAGGATITVVVPEGAAPGSVMTVAAPVGGVDERGYAPPGAAGGAEVIINPASDNVCGGMCSCEF